MWGSPLKLGLLEFLTLRLSTRENPVCCDYLYPPACLSSFRDSDLFYDLHSLWDIQSHRFSVCPAFHVLGWSNASQAPSMPNQKAETLSISFFTLYFLPYFHDIPFFWFSNSSNLSSVFLSTLRLGSSRILLSPHVTLPWGPSPSTALTHTRTTVSSDSTSSVPDVLWAPQNQCLQTAFIFCESSILIP